MGIMKCSAALISTLMAVPLCVVAQLKEDPSIIVAGRIERQRLTVTASDIGKLAKKTVKVTAANGQVATFEGVALQDVLDLAGVLFGQKLQGARLMAFVVVEGAPPTVEATFKPHDGDDYRALFSLPELDSSFAEKEPVILAITENGKPLSPPDGPYRVIVPGDRRPNRWVKDVKMIWVLHADSVLGFQAPR
jgi:DMSO/TMAO reductase YedYZ molybdopterin-dependent catalytic subunit